MDPRMAFCAVVAEVTGVDPRDPGGAELLPLLGLAWAHGAACARHQSAWTNQILDAMAADGAGGDAEEAAATVRRYPLGEVTP